MSEIRMYCPCSLQGLYELMMVISGAQAPTQCQVWAAP